LIERSDHAAPSVFRPQNMLRVARRQRGLRDGEVPPLCVLDPDGDLVRFVRARRSAALSAHWACYHTQMWEWREGDRHYGVVGCAVGASFAVLVAEQLFVSGCELLVSVSSAGQIADASPPPYHILIDRALRDEGTSYHYLPPAAYVEADLGLVELAVRAFAMCGTTVVRGATWTTGAPFRETAATVALRKAEGLLAVEMEASALYAFATAGSRPILCLAHVTNQLGNGATDFEKGVDNGAALTLGLIDAFATEWLEGRASIAP
jgi:nucleoside phosphorylase